ncbi:MAG: TIGR00730 family Rossman fold protein [Chitinophagaceae bacterium]|nr:TIGR00730 family Rossman fold protein [Chitinophagaceae bacterium]
MNDEQGKPKISKEERYFLEGPHSRWTEFKFIIKVMREFIRGYRKLHFVGPSVTVFGSARFDEDHEYYKLAREVGKEIVKLGFNVMTGGGPGIMEAANRGAQDAGGRSLGCNIILPHEQMPNGYLDKWVSMDLFFVRKVLLTKYSYAFVVLPGGYGTMDELFESLTLIQTGKIEKFPIVLMVKEYHKELYDHIQEMVKNKTISPQDVELFLFTDSIQEAMEHIEKHAIHGFGLTKRRVIKPMSIFGEK